MEDSYYDKLAYPLYTQALVVLVAAYEKGPMMCEK